VTVNTVRHTTARILKRRFAQGNGPLKGPRRARHGVANGHEQGRTAPSGSLEPHLDSAVDGLGRPPQ
jgi:hypothetical protein